MADTPYGRYLSAAEAAPVLAFAGIGPNDDIGEGRVVDYNGSVYWVLQTGVKFPNPTSTSPDGWHNVYAPSAGEIELGTLPKEPDLLGGISDVLKIAAVVLAIVFGIQVVKGLK